MRCLVTLFSFVLFWGEAWSQQVNTPDGPVLGITGTTNSGKTYYSYFSLRYAKPPIGSRRFLSPEPIDPWTELYNATTENTNICYQLGSDYPEETEDCLFLNVFTPKSPSDSKENLPVMVNIHGGGFVQGTGHSGGVIGGISPKYLLEDNVIMVTISYRLGVFGFLTTGDSVIPGNAGLKDQVLALKWIQRNIAAFGGDPNRVTIMGQSAGGASVGYLLLSPAAKSLFSSAIAESGSPLCPWAYQRNQTEISFMTASYVDPQFKTSRDSVALLNILQNVSAKDIDAAQTNYSNWAYSQPDAVALTQIHQGFDYAPVIEVNHTDAFLTEFQYESLEYGYINKVPTLMGITSEEGLMNVDAYLDYYVQSYDNNLGYMNPQDVHINGPTAWQEVANLIKQEYSPNSTFLENKVQAIKYWTEQDFGKAVTKHAELQSSYTDVYFYQFSYAGTMSGNAKARYPGSGNCTHVEEWMYLFGGWPPEGYPESDQLVHNRMIRLWTNFATYHNPTPNQDELLQNIIWPKVKPGNFQYVNIGNFDKTDLTVTQGKPKAERMAFWDSIYEKYGVRPFDTY